jgi:hypothetical protein
MKNMYSCAGLDQIWGAQAASLQFAAACREHDVDFGLTLTMIHPASCRVVQAGSLRSPDLVSPPIHDRYSSEI